MPRVGSLGTVLAALGLVACGSTSASSPATAASASPATAKPVMNAAPPQQPPLLILSEQRASGGVVRLVSLDASDVASTSGNYLSVTGGEVVVLDGATLKTVAYDGTVRNIGTVAALPQGSDPKHVVVSPDRSQWLYSVTDFTSLVSTIHLGNPTSDRVVTTLASPNGNAYMAPFAWTASGVYFVMYATGIGGAGPFLEYNFPLWQFDLGTLKASPVSPACTIVALASNGAKLCSAGAHRYTVVPPGEAPHDVTVVGESDAERLSLDGTRVALAHNGGTEASAFYQIATFGMGDSAASDFGPRDFVPDTWLPDGRLLASHRCIDPSFQGAPCDSSKDGTYIFSADGTSNTLFYKWPAARQVTVAACLPGTP